MASEINYRQHVEVLLLQRSRAKYQSVDLIDKLKSVLGYQFPVSQAHRMKS